MFLEKKREPVKSKRYLSLSLSLSLSMSLNLSISESLNLNLSLSLSLSSKETENKEGQSSVGEPVSLYTPPPPDHPPLRRPYVINTTIDVDDKTHVFFATLKALKT